MKFSAFVACIALAVTALGATPTAEPYTFNVTNRTLEPIRVAMAMRNGNEAGSIHIAVGASGRLVFRHLPELLEARSKDCHASVAVPPSPHRAYFAIVNIINGNCAMHI